MKREKNTSPDYKLNKKTNYEISINMKTTLKISKDTLINLCYKSDIEISFICSNSQSVYKREKEKETGEAMDERGRHGNSNKTKAKRLLESNMKRS